MFGLFGIFGRARELRQLDQALRAVDLHPNLVPEAVKLTAVRLARAQDGAAARPFAATAELLAYCMIGADGYAGANGEAAVSAVEQRVEAALDAGDSVDAQLILLAVHANVIQPSVVARYGIEVG